jgi:hypothetical protein
MRHLAHGRPKPMLAVLVCFAAIATISGCSDGSPTGSGSSSGGSNSSSSTTTGSAAAPTDTTWLCRPGLANNPCTSNLDYTTVKADGSTTVTRVAPVPDPPVDCFYVYPTVSEQTTENADLTIDPAETTWAIEQAARFSQICNVWAPMYQQGTLLALAQANGLSMDPAVLNVAYQSLLSGWQDYLAHHNNGRPIVFLAHSQGSTLTMRLLSEVVEANPALLHQVVSAIIPGGNVEVPTVVGGSGTFSQLPLCRSPGQISCVIAYSTYPSLPPANAVFSRPGEGVSTGEPGDPATTQVACVNPATLGGGTAPLDTFLTTQESPTPGITVTTPWVEYPGRYIATCTSEADATWLEAVATPGDPRPVVTVKSPQLGYHPYDLNLPLGNLVPEVQAQVAAYLAANP